MSINTDPTGDCHGKQRFESFGAAERISRRTASRRHTQMHVYRCRHCAGFNFGSRVGYTPARK